MKCGGFLNGRVVGIRVIGRDRGGEVFRLVHREVFRLVHRERAVS